MATAKILINLYDGTRQLLPPATRALLTVTDGNKQVVFRDFLKASTSLWTSRSTTTFATNTPCSPRLTAQLPRASFP